MSQRQALRGGHAAAPPPPTAAAAASRAPLATGGNRGATAATGKAKLAALRSPGVTYKAAAGSAAGAAAASSLAAAAAMAAPAAARAGGAAASDGGAFSASSLSAALIGLPPVAEALRAVFDADPKPEFGKDYAEVLATSDSIGRPRNALPGQDRKAHEDMIKNIIAALKAALRDALARKVAAIDRCREIEAAIAAKFFEATKLAGALRDAHAATAAKDTECATLRRELEHAIAQITTAKANEQGADAELEEALASAAEAATRVAELEARIGALETELAEQRVVEEGLRADVDERDERLAAVSRDASAGRDALAAELTRVRAAGDAAAAAAATRIAALEGAASAGSANLRAAEARIKELERAASVGEADALKLRSESEAAAQIKSSLAAEMERVREQSRLMEATYASQIASLTRTGEITSRHCVDLTRQLEAKAARAEELLLERDALRSSESDLRRELRDAARVEADTNTKLAAATATAERTARELEAARVEMTRLGAELRETTARLERTTSDAAAAREELLSDLALAGGKLVDAETKLATAGAAEAAWAARAVEWDAARTELSAGKASAEEAVADLTSQLTALRESAGASEESQLERLTQMSREAETLRRRMKEMRDITGRLAAAEAEAARLREEAFGNEMARRALHNAVQELKGNIRVCVRVRPFLGVDAAEAAADDDGGDGGGPAIAVAPDGTSLTIAPPPPRGTKAGPLHGAGGALTAPARPLPFAFDTVFSPRASQADVFAEVSHLVQSALDGYNVCLFSYGQTGSGKTWTMQGGPDPDDRGLIPRSVEQILDTAGRLAASGGWTYRLEASFLEIYNESIRDLLRAPAAAGRGGAAAAPAALSLHQLDGNDPAGGIEVPGLTRVPIACADDVVAVLARAARRRAVAATDMNEVSSRSHCVFTLAIHGAHARRGIAVSGALNLVDLAGSERLDRSGAEGDRKRETAAINKSLSCLADVFAALAAHKPHVPFRNSKLTHLLAPCFSRDGKTLMLVNLSPSPASAAESLCSLRFASQVGQVELGKPRRRVVEALPATSAAVAAPAAVASRSSATPYAAAAAASGAGRAASARAAAAADPEDDARSIASVGTTATGVGGLRESLLASPPAINVDDAGEEEEVGEDDGGDGAPAALRGGGPLGAPSPAARSIAGGGLGASLSSSSRAMAPPSQPARRGTAALAAPHSAAQPARRPAAAAAPGSAAAAQRPGGASAAARPTLGQRPATAAPASAAGVKRPVAPLARGAAAGGGAGTASAPASENKRPRFGR